MGSFRMRSGLALTLAGTMALAGASVAVAQDTEVAYLSASSANTWLGTSRVEMEKVAAENGLPLGQ